VVADLLARGSLSSVTFPGMTSQWHIDRRLAAHSCGGSRGIARSQARAPRSLLIPIGNHRENLGFATGSSQGNFTSETFGLSTFALGTPGL